MSKRWFFTTEAKAFFRSLESLMQEPSWFRHPKPDARLNERGQRELGRRRLTEDEYLRFKEWRLREDAQERLEFKRAQREDPVTPPSTERESGLGVRAPRPEDRPAA